ncbi:MAG: leucyl aminopeptidase family protein [Dermatophilaceae bacterium]
MVPPALPPLDLPVVQVVADAATGTDRSPSARADAPPNRLLAVAETDLAQVALAGLDEGAVRAAHTSQARAGAIVVIPVPPTPEGIRAVAVVGLGDNSPGHARVAGAALGRAARDRDELLVGIPVQSAEHTRALVEGALLGGFVGPTWAATPRHRQVGVVSLVCHDARAAADGRAHAAASVLARSLVAVPSNIKSPAWLAAQAKRVAKAGGATATVWSLAALRQDGFGGLIAVGGGSTNPPRFVRIDYVPKGHLGQPTTPGRRRRVDHVVLVGKGITFDSGGLDIKPPASMLTMKTDMTGAAVVLAVLGACQGLEIPVRVTGLLPLAENAVSGSAYRPGDVVTQYGGTTVEIGNTDAEGRIVLADALAYADSQLDPDVLIDVATLTGAATLALGRSIGPLFSTDERLQEALLAAGRAAGEPMWPFPLVDDYRPWLDSPVADLGHVSSKPPMAGAIVAALFLREFTGGRAWAHLDIAGPGRSETDTGTNQVGGTGYGARLLLRYLESLR